MTATDLLTYCRSAHTPQRMVLAGSGVDHDRLVDMARKHFVGKTPVWEEHQGVSDVPLDQSVAQYTGGILKVSGGPCVSCYSHRSSDCTCNTSLSSDCTCNTSLSSDCQRIAFPRHSQRCLLTGVEGHDDLVHRAVAHAKPAAFCRR